MKEVIAQLHTNRILRWQAIVFLIVSLSFIVTNGLYNCWFGTCGVTVGQWHMHDAFWHISMAKIAFQTWPFSHPFFAGETVFGYNYLIDLILFGLTKIGISPFIGFFQVLPVAIALTYTTTVVWYVGKFTRNHSEQNATAFFLFFGNSLAYLATLYAQHTFFYASLRGFPVVTSIQPTMMFLNLQYALSLVGILLALSIFRTSLQARSVLYLGLLTFAVSGLKFYGGIVLMLVMGGMIGLRLIRRDHPRLRIAQLAFMTLGILLARALFYSNAGSDGFPFAFWPLALPHVLIDDPVLFNNHSWTLARYFLYEHGGWRSPRLLALEGFTVFLLAIMNFGTRLLGLALLGIKKLRMQLHGDDIITILVIIGTFAMPVFFVQDGGWFNTMQFLYYGIFLASFYAGKVLAYLFESKKWWTRLLAACVIVLTLPNMIEQLRFVTAKQNIVPQSEVEVLEKLSHAPGKVVYISNPELKNAIVPAFSGKTAYYLDVDQLMVTHVDYAARREEVLHVNPQNVANLPVDYFYIYRRDEGGEALITALENSPHITKFAETADLVVFQR